MTPYAQAIWSGLEFRKTMMLRNVEPLDEQQMRWLPAPERKSIAWHSDQIALTAKLLPDTPVSTMKFDYWKTKNWQQDA